jgi:hypothetical protein
MFNIITKTSCAAYMNSKLANMHQRMQNKFYIKYVRFRAFIKTLWKKSLKNNV